MTKNFSKKRSSRNSKTSQKSTKTSVQSIADSSSYKGQARLTTKLPTISAIQTTTITTGVIASSIGISTSLINGFSTRFGLTFDEYRILKVYCKIRPLAVSTGVTRFLFDEKNSSAVSATGSTQRVGKTLANNAADPKSVTMMTWSARDLLDLQYTAIGSTVTPVYFKIYTDSTNYGAPATATALWLIEFDLTVEFRGLAASA